MLRTPSFSRPLLGVTMVLVSLAVSAGRCERGSKELEASQDLVDFLSRASIDQTQLKNDLVEIAREPHPMGSERQQAVASYLERRAKESGHAVITDPFTASVPNPALTGPASMLTQTTLERRGMNLFAFAELKPKLSCVVLVASHYDTKDIAGTANHGANDSGSSSAALFAVLRLAKGFVAAGHDDVECDVAAVWFDGEEAVLPGWYDGESHHPAQIKDNTYGSRHVARSLEPCGDGRESSHCLPKRLGGQALAGVILLDMVGSPGISITREIHSSPALVRLMQAFDAKLFSPSIVSKRAEAPIEDDHVPFRMLGIPAIDLIDFQNLERWHRPGDDVEFVELASIDKAARLAAAMALELARKPGAAQ